MSLHFRYALRPSNQPVLSLGGRFSRPRPIVAVLLRGPAGDHPVDAWIDIGAEDTVFPDWVAARVGIDLTGAPAGTGSGIGIAFVPLRLAEVTMRLTDGRELREWRALVGFTAAKLRHPLLGFAGFLQFFTATFHGDREEVELAVNNLYPGT